DPWTWVPSTEHDLVNKINETPLTTRGSHNTTSELKTFNPEGGNSDHVAGLTRTNGQRAASAERVFQQYPSDCHATEKLTDLFTDLLHLAHREGWNFDEALALATQHFIDETNGA